jgi:hypothetical protein
MSSIRSIHACKQTLSLMPAYWSVTGLPSAINFNSIDRQPETTRVREGWDG